jgi:hypothetical protein
MPRFEKRVAAEQRKMSPRRRSFKMTPIQAQSLGKLHWAIG